MPNLRSLAIAFGLVAVCGCSVRPAGSAESASGEVVGRFVGGVLTREELEREAARLPPSLRQQFETPAGRREFANSMIDKRLLVQEARRRAFNEDPEIRRQVRELEERLLVQALLGAQERAAGAPSEAALRAFYEANKQDFSLSERVRVVRVLAAAPSGAGQRARLQAQERARGFLEQLRRGEPAAKVARNGDGPEKARGGDLGFLSRGDSEDRRLEDAAFALSEPGAVSPVFACEEGFAVLQLVERIGARTPPFEEVRGDVEGRVAPGQKRRAFDELLARLRTEADVRVDLAAGE